MKLSFIQFLLLIRTKKLLHSGQLADSAGNPQGWWMLVEGIHSEIWVVSETRIHVDIQGKFLKRGRNESEVPKIFKHFSSPKADINSSLGHFHINGTLPLSLICILKF